MKPAPPRRRSSAVKWVALLLAIVAGAMMLIMNLVYVRGFRPVQPRPVQPRLVDTHREVAQPLSVAASPQPARRRARSAPQPPCTVPAGGVDVVVPAFDLLADQAAPVGDPSSGWLAAVTSFVRAHQVLVDAGSVRVVVVGGGGEVTGLESVPGVVHHQVTVTHGDMAPAAALRYALLEAGAGGGGERAVVYLDPGVLVPAADAEAPPADCRTMVEELACLWGEGAEVVGGKVVMQGVAAANPPPRPRPAPSDIWDGDRCASLAGPANNFVASFGVGVQDGASPVLAPRLAGYSARDYRTLRHTPTPLVAPHGYVGFAPAFVAALRSADVPLPEGGSGHDEYRGGGHVLLSGAAKYEVFYRLALAAHERGDGGGAPRVVTSAYPVVLQQSRKSGAWDGVVTEEGGSHGVAVQRFTRGFRDAWEGALRRRFLDHTPLSVTWETFCMRCFGFTNELMNFLVPLEALVPKLYSKQSPPKCFCPGNPAAFDTALRRIGHERDWIHQGARGTTFVRIFHLDPGSYPKTRPRPGYTIGRSMNEFTRVATHWVAPANANTMDEIWVPSTFVYAAFKDSGIHAKKLHVMPEPIDTAMYDPEVVEAVVLPLQQGNAWRRGSTHDAPSPAYSKDGAHGRDLRQNYKFLSVFKLEPRKGWDVLAKAWAQAFTRDDPVSLYLMCYVYGGSDGRDPNKILDMIAAEAMVPVSELPHIEVITQEVSEREMVQIYKAVDAFVIPTRGEGWGLPIIQAMSMGLPAIATNFSGNVDFMTEDTSYLLEVAGVNTLPAMKMYGNLPAETRWAEPSLKHLQHLLKHLSAHPEEGRAVGQRARAHVRKRFDAVVVAELVRKRLMEIRQLQGH